MSDNTLIVALDVAALVVGLGDVQANARTLAAMADFSQLPASGRPGPWLSEPVLANSQPFEGEQPALAGIHLHWNLPRQLTRGKTEKQALIFPAVPNRWLVTRIALLANGTDSVVPVLRSWVVESDRCTDSAEVAPGKLQTTLPFENEQSGPGFAWLGKVFDADQWQEQPGPVARTPKPLTALGYGEPTFAAFYPNCSSVFGFHDDLGGLSTEKQVGLTLSYQVSGWYSDSEQDPLQQPSGASQFGWKAPSGNEPGQQPNALFLSGIVDGIAWQADKQYLQQDKAQDKPSLTVAIATSTREALSALMADELSPDNTDRLDNTEEVLNALQFGLLSDADNQATSLTRFEEAVHDAGFVTLSGGAVWSIDPVTKTDKKDAQEADAKTPQASVEQTKALGDLNDLQGQVNVLERDIQALQSQLFIDWYRYQMIAHASARVPSNLQNARPEMVKRLQDQVAEINTRQAKLDTLLDGINQRDKALSADLPTLLTLSKQTAAPRFYQPVEPVLMLAGADVQPAARHAPDTGNDDDSHCRLASQLIDSVTLASGAVPGSPAMSLDTKDVVQLNIPASLAQAPVLQALLVDALHVGPALQAVLVEELARQAAANGQGPLDRPATLALLSNACKTLSGDPADPVHYQGCAPGPDYCQAWDEAMWMPFLLQYEVQLRPVQTGALVGPAFIQNHFSFSFDALDLSYTGEELAPAQTYRASALLSANATLGLAAEIKRHLDSRGTPALPLEQLLDKVRRLPLLAQSMTGFNDALLMQQHTLQMHVRDPQESLLASQVEAAVGVNNRLSPLAHNSFMPLRAGLLHVERLRLVDVFGRFKDYQTLHTVVAKGLQPPSSMSDREGAFLPPRLIQPARLQFRWRAARQSSLESNNASSSSPVLGWIMPNHLDNALMIYAANGMPLGELALTGARVVWTPAPMGGFAFGTALASVFKGQPADLTHFAERLYNNGQSEHLAPFLASVNNALRFSLPAQFAETAQQVVLTGQPLVLARASLALELAGPAAHHQGWDRFERSLLHNDQPDDAGVRQVRFPVRLGALNQLDDTLVGYWIDPKCREDFQHFHAPYDDAIKAGDSPQPHDALTLVPSADPVEVLMLLDPRGSVHASSGILPVKNIDIPPVHYAPALASLEVTFENFPVLSGRTLPDVGDPNSPMSMILPGVASGDWHWIIADNQTWNSTALTDINNAKSTLDYSPQHITEGWLRIRRSVGEKKAE